MKAIRFVELCKKAIYALRILDVPIQTLLKWLTEYRENRESTIAASGK